MKLKLNKLDFTCIDEETGKLYLRSLVGKDVDQWDAFMIQVCMFARDHGKNPKWHELKWHQTEIKAKGRNKKLLEEVLDNSE